MGIVIPNWSEIEKLGTGLTDGERYLTKIFEKYLDKEWKIYVQPYLNGLRPDIVLFKRNEKVWIIEVKDWTVHTLNKSLQEDDKISRNGRRRSRVFEQIAKYHSRFLRTVVPIFAEKESTLMSFFQTRAFFFKIDINSLRQAYLHETEGRRKRLVSKDNLNDLLGQIMNGNYKIINKANHFYNTVKRDDYKEDLYDTIESWLKFPSHAKEQYFSYTELSITNGKHFNELIQKTHTKQKIKGGVGTGKTEILSHIAAEKAAINKKVLVLSYNITMWHVIRDRIMRNFRQQKIENKTNNIRFTHFHRFCIDWLNENHIAYTIPNEKKEPEKCKAWFDTTCAEIILSNFRKPGETYDYILVDEGQDFKALWYDVLDKFLDEQGDKVLFSFADPLQNIYDRVWKEDFETLKGFEGRPRQLKQSHRFSDQLIEKLNDYSDMFFKDDINKVRLSRPEWGKKRLFNEVQLYWNNVQTEREFFDGILPVFDYFSKQKNIHPSDISYLTINMKDSKTIMEALTKKNIQVCHTIDEDVHEKKNKNSFWMGDGRVKVSTLHSFKGWESEVIVLFIPPEGDCQNNRLEELVYTGLSQTKGPLVVFNRHPKFNAYGEKWKRFPMKNTVDLTDPWPSI